MGRFKDLTGMKFNRLTVIKENGRDKWGGVLWLCKCDCGNEITVLGKSLTRGTTKSCGCYKKDKTSERNKKDITNKKFGKLTAIKPLGTDENNNVKWLCKCDCGNEVVVLTSSLTKGNTKSCGCLQKEGLKQLNIERWKDEEYRNKMTEILTEQWDDKAKEEQAKRMKQKWENKDFRKANTGTNHHKYNSNLTDEDRQDRRLIEGYDEWRYKVKEKANFTCDCCGKRDGGHLNAHHLDGYNWCKKGRLDITNGVCLCESCHKEFHNIYGRGNNTKEQYIEFKENKNKGEM